MHSETSVSSKAPPTGGAFLCFGPSGIAYFGPVARRTPIQLSLRTRIYFTMLALILISFVLTGVTAFYNFKSQNEEYNVERFRRKEGAVQESMRYFLQQRGGYIPPDSIRMVFDDKICELADVHRMDIHLFDLRGNLLISSVPFNNTVRDEIEYTIFKQLTSGNTRAEIEKQVNGIPSILAYWYFTDALGRQMAITNVQYDKTEVNREELSSFLLQLTQIYVVLFVGAAILAYFLSNYITKSLQHIGKRMQQIRVDGHNDPLQWSSDDEIGALVKEYNHMLQKVEDSAAQLARSERDAAWREMAKQVAHEIKNPLTPMKLRVQHLQRSWEDEAPNFEERLKQTGQTLIEQIDSLAHIASEFSNFAKMPRAQRVEVDLVAILEQSSDLFADNGNVTVTLHNLVQGPAHVVADREQMKRVFTNLIKNAVQAMVEDRPGTIDITLTRNGDYYHVAVADNGKGIAPEDYGRIFVPNFTTKSKGMGLGLAMVKNIITSSGGHMTFTSIQGEGTTFTLQLPVNQSKT